MNGMNVKELGGKIITVQLGKTFAIHLWEDRTRGEQWVPDYEPEAFVMVDDEFLRTTSNNAVDAGSRTFEFQALKPGSHRLEFNKRLAWKFTSEDRRVFHVDVRKAEG